MEPAWHFWLWSQVLCKQQLLYHQGNDLPAFVEGNPAPHEAAVFSYVDYDIRVPARIILICFVVLCKCSILQKQCTRLTCRGEGSACFHG